MTANQVLEALRKDGRAVVLDGNKIRCNPMPDGDLLEQVKEHKAALVRLLEIERLQDTCLELIGLCPEAAEKLDALLGEAIANDWKDTLALEMKVVEAFVRFVDPEYRAAIWGNKTWREYNNGLERTTAGVGGGERQGRPAADPLRPMADPLPDLAKPGAPGREMHPPGHLPGTDLLPGLS